MSFDSSESSQTHYNAVADSKLTSANISDSLDKCGRRGQVLNHRLQGLLSDQRIFGRARTVVFEPDEVMEPEKPYDDMIDFIDSVESGEIVVIATGGSNATAFWGELFSAAAKARGAVGVITDGNIRDTEKVIRIGFPAFSSDRRPLDFRGRMKVASRQVPVLIEGVWIHPGELVMADNDGVVVIPAEMEEQILQEARDRVMTESTVLAELQAGSTLREVWDRHHVL